MLTLAGFEVLEARVPLRFTFRHSRSTRDAGEGVLVRAMAADGREGFGEAAPRSYVTGETTASVRETLERTLAPPLLGSRFGSFEEAADALRRRLPSIARDQLAAFCALELAVLDLAGRVFGRSAGDVLGPVTRTEVRYGAVVSADGVEEVAKTCERIRHFGFADVKLKVGPDATRDLENLRRARELLGRHVTLRVDANGAWGAEEALRRVESFAPFDVRAVEQPLPPEDLDGLVWLTARSPVPIVADESLASLDDAERLAGRGAAHVFNVRISKCGGLLNAGRIRDRARASGIGCMLGAQVGELALLSAAGRHFATRSPDLLFLEGSYGRLLLEEDVGEPDLTFGPGGRAGALDGPGLGIEVDPARVERFVRHRSRIGGG